jgi:hypothetical protein
MPLRWLLYLGLPITAAGVLFALRLINLGAGWSTKVLDAKHDFGAHARPIAVAPPQPSVQVPVSQRLRELEAPRATGAISDTEYCALRLTVMGPRSHRGD